MLLLFKSFLALKILIPQFSRYYTLLKFNVYISLSIFIAQIIIFLLKLSGVVFLLAVLINNKDIGIYIPVLKLLINLVI